MPSYKFNTNYFDEINTEEKAYWLGFIWCDGYTMKRTREGKVTEIPVKINLSEVDEDHLKKLKEAIESNHPIHKYKTNAINKESFEVRLTLNKMHFGNTLYEKYGMIPHRNEISKLVQHIPKELVRHFIRGVFDAEGSFTMYFHKIKEHYNPSLKMTMSIDTYEELLEFIQDHLIESGLKNNKVKLNIRHEGRDGHCRNLKLSGTNQVLKIAEYLYENAKVYMDRKYKKFLEMKNTYNEREMV